MTAEFTTAFEKLWTAFRAQWCQTHDLDGARAFSHTRIKNTFFHRVVQVDIPAKEADRLIDAALALYRAQNFDCIFTLSPLDRPADLGAHLLRRGFARGIEASAMQYDPPAPIVPTTSTVEVSTVPASGYDKWAALMCQSFDFPAAMGAVGRTVLLASQARRYWALLDGTPVGTALLYSQGGLGYIDLVGTLAPYRRRGVASALVQRAVADSQAQGNRWTALEATSGSAAEGLYQRLGFRPIYHRQRYIKPHGEIR